MRGYEEYDHELHRPAHANTQDVLLTSRAFVVLCSRSFRAHMSLGSRRKASEKSDTASTYFPRLWRTIPLRIQAFLNARSRAIAL